MKRYIDPEIKKLSLNIQLQEKSKSKNYNFKFEDFDIVGGNWKHKDWNTWMKGGDGYAETEKIVKRYIAECKKPYGTRDLSFIHLANDN